MRLCVLSSGSAGNCLWVEAGGARVLVDAGLSARETARRCAEAGLRLTDVTAILLTHEHADHAGGAGVLSRKLSVPVHCTRGTFAALRDPPPVELWRPLRAGEPVLLSALGPLERSALERSALERSALERSGLHDGAAHSRPIAPVEQLHEGTPIALPTPLVRSQPQGPQLWAMPLRVAHDATEPVAYSLEERHEGGRSVRMANVTDLGHAPAQLASQLEGHDALVLEMNHDLRRLLDGPYPWSLKNRVRSPVGHLSNAQGAGLLAAVLHAGLRAVVLAHLSQENNTPGLALAAAEPVLTRAGSSARLMLGSQEGVGEVLELAPLPRPAARPRQLQLF